MGGVEPCQVGSIAGVVWCVAWQAWAVMLWQTFELYVATWQAARHRCPLIELSSNGQEDDFLRPAPGKWSALQTLSATDVEHSVAGRK